MFSRFLAAAAAMSLASALVVAAPAPASVDRASLSVSDANELQGGQIFPPILAAVIVVLGVLTATGVLFDDDEAPDSP